MLYLVATRHPGARLIRARLCALALVVRHETAIRAVAAALLAKGSLTAREAHQIFNRASWPAAALNGEVTKPLTLRDQLIFGLELL